MNFPFQRKNRPKQKALIAIGDLIPGIVYHPPKNQKLHYEVGLRQINDQWATIVGELVAKKTQPFRIQQKTLWVEALGSSWANELNLLKPQLIEKIKKLFPQINVADLKFQSVTRLRGSIG